MKPFKFLDIKVTLAEFKANSTAAQKRFEAAIRRKIFRQIIHGKANQQVKHDLG